MLSTTCKHTRTMHASETYVSVVEENNWMHHQWLDMAAFSVCIILLLN